MCTSPIEKLLPWLLTGEASFFFSSFFFPSCYHFSLFYLEPSAGCCCQQMIATFPPESHLITPTGGGKKSLRAVNELPSLPRVRGACKLTGAFVRPPFGLFPIRPPLSPPPLLLPLLHFLPLPACFTLRQLHGQSGTVWLAVGAVHV